MNLVQGILSAQHLSPRIPRILVLGCCAALLCASAARAEEFEAISSKTAKDYVRKKLPDGTFQPESYTFGKGDDWRGARVDPTIDKLDFMDVARALAKQLAEKKYFPTAEAKTTDELIMIYWGTTRAPEHASESSNYQLFQRSSQLQKIAQVMLKDAESGYGDLRAAKQDLAAANAEMSVALSGIQAENLRRDDQNMRNVAMLGYDSWWIATAGAMGGSPMGYRKQDLVTEIEEDRYFIVLMAFDYQLLTKQKKNKFLWETRFSIREHTNAFDKRMPDMIAQAAEYFGRDSGGLQHLQLPEGKVEIGPVQSLGVVSGNLSPNPTKP